MPAQGHVVQREWKSGRGYALRFIAYGTRRYVTLGTRADGWTRARAEEELANILADVRRGIWIPPTRRTPTQPTAAERPGEVPVFHAFASDWLAGRHGEVTPRMHEYLQWALTHHLLAFFANHRLDEIDIPAVDAYRQTKLTQAQKRREAIQAGRPLTDATGRTLRPLGATTINKTIDVLQAVLATAVEYDHIPKNPAAGRRRRLKAPARRPVHLDTAQQITALLAAATELDHDPAHTLCDRHANIACLLFAGPRAHEHTALRWRDVDLTNHRLHITKSKTQAGLRVVYTFPKSF